MKFIAFKEFKSVINIENIASYLKNDLKKTLTDLQTGLTRLKFEDNFESFITEVEVPALTEVEIRNNLRSQKIPQYKIILRGGDGSQNVTDGDTEWNQNFVYLKNRGATTVTVMVLFIT